MAQPEPVLPRRPSRRRRFICSSNNACNTAWLRAMAGCESGAEGRFAAWTAACARRPALTIAANFLAAILLGLGFLNIVIETKGDRLWVDQNSLLKEQQDYITETYILQPRVNFVVLAANPMGGDALTAGPIAMMHGLHDQILALETSDGFGWSDVCERDAFDRCSVTGAMQFFATPAAGVNTTLFANLSTAAIKQLIAPPAGGSPWVLPSGGPVVLDNVFMSWDAAATSAVGARSYYLLQGEFFGRCEREGISREDCTSGKREDVQLELEEKMIELLEPLMLHSRDGAIQSPEGAGMVYLQTFRSLDDELLRAVSGDIVLFALTMNIMCTFCCVVLGRTCGGKCLESRFLLANGGLGLVMFAMIGGYGLCAGLGWQFTQLQQILPFILIGIGVDDMVIIAAAFDRVSAQEPGAPIDVRVGKAYARCGLSITLTSATDVTAFVSAATAGLGCDCCRL